MRLLLITNVYPSPRRPTKGTFNGEMVAGLRDAGDEVRVVVPMPWTDLLATRASGPPPPGVTCPFWFYPPRWKHATHHHWMARTIVPAALRAVRGWSPDLVLGYWTHPDGAMAVRVARRLGVPSVVLAGGSDILINTADRARRTEVVRVLQQTDRVLAVGASLRDAIVALGVAPAQVGAFFRGVDRQVFHPGDQAEARTMLDLPADRPVVLWVGRMAPVKGLDVLLAAWQRVVDHPTHPLLVLVGDGAERTLLEQGAARLGDGVRFAGSIAHDQLAPWYRAADLMVLPSRSEGMPNVLLEALACGTPFVASAVGSVIELAGPGNDLVPPGDLEALATTLRTRLDGHYRQRATTPVPDRQEATAALHAQLQAVVAAPRRDRQVA
ncbi:MAG TPA: glycosyltransferase [Gemmatimonadales bacterium]|jgi:glycosyltransferase involved in cell wall biosynthesis